jgi:Na+-transporting methylmalonyl-CoA/oxaloacetate decarboxylase beta subunit
MKGAAFPFPIPPSPWGMLVMFAVAAALIYVAIRKEYEPTLLLPIGFGALLGNLPNSPLNHPGGLL